MTQSERDEINSLGSLATVLLEREGGSPEIFENLPDGRGFVRLNRRDRSLGEGRKSNHRSQS
jgi:hypothetical protein